mmetsp:Transcript_17753/g.44746  ORF Transcript_17753/g.44746 Transcript_17753/m.44746 type:complete len:85 (-) Transcript_17753:224-478(-)
MSAHNDCCWQGTDVVLVQTQARCYNAAHVDAGTRVQAGHGLQAQPVADTNGGHGAFRDSSVQVQCQHQHPSISRLCMGCMHDTC